METKLYKIDDLTKRTNEIEAAAALLRAGQVVAFPTETVYGLAANALDGAAVRKIFEAKGRPQDNPLIVHIASPDEMETVASSVPDSARALAAAFWPGPLTIILPKKDCVPDTVSAGLSTVAIRLPAHPVAQAVIRAAGVPLAAPSANISGFPSPTTARDVMDDMAGRIPAVLDGGACRYGIESTVITLVTDPPRILRPGAVTPAQLERVLGKVEVDETALQPLEAGKQAQSPGMKYKHYAPRAELSIVRDSLAHFLIFLKKHPDMANAALCFEGEPPYIPLKSVTFGKKDDPLSQAQRLFDALRELDRTGAKKALARMPDAEGVGLGVCNRLFRAAGFRIVSNEKKDAIIGVCGGSGAGKSRLCALLADIGAEVIDADAVAREVTLPGSPVLSALQAAFGADILFPDGSLDRKTLASRAFGDPARTAKLTAITHPEILRRIESRALAAAENGQTVIIDAPLLFSSGLDRLCGLTVRLFASEDVRRARLKEREGLTDEEISRRFLSQETENLLAKKADLVICNDPSDDMQAQIKTIFF